MNLTGGDAVLLVTAKMTASLIFTAGTILLVFLLLLIPEATMLMTLLSDK